MICKSKGWKKKVGKVGGNQNRWRSIWQLVRSSVNRSVTCLGVKGAFQRGRDYVKMSRGLLICDKLHLKMMEIFEKETRLQVKGVHSSSGFKHRPGPTGHDCRSSGAPEITVWTQFTVKCELKLNHARNKILFTFYIASRLAWYWGILISNRSDRVAVNRDNSFTT